MEKTTIYIHTTRDKEFCIDDDLEIAEDDLQDDKITNYRVVTFVNGKRDIMNVIKDLIKDQHQSR